MQKLIQFSATFHHIEAHFFIEFYLFFRLLIWLVLLSLFVTVSGSILLFVSAKFYLFTQFLLLSSANMMWESLNRIEFFVLFFSCWWQMLILLHQMNERKKKMNKKLSSKITWQDMNKSYTTTTRGNNWKLFIFGLFLFFFFHNSLKCNINVSLLFLVGEIIINSLAHNK